VSDLSLGRECRRPAHQPMPPRPPATNIVAVEEEMGWIIATPN
jgi:hypothetical protein